MHPALLEMIEYATKNNISSGLVTNGRKLADNDFCKALADKGLKNIAISSTSACMSAAAVPSYVLAAMGLPKERIFGSVRFGLGRFTSEEEIVYTINAVSQCVEQLQKSSPLYQIKGSVEV